jgi:hypothetical protein
MTKLALSQAAANAAAATAAADIEEIDITPPAASAPTYSATPNPALATAPPPKSDSMPLHRAPAEVLRRIAAPLAPTHQMRLSLVSHHLYETLNLRAKQALKAKLAHEVQLLGNLSVFDDTKIPVLMAQNLLASIQKLPPDDQAEVLINVMKKSMEIRETTTSGTDFDHHVQTISPDILRPLLLKAALKMTPSNPLQIEALKLLMIETPQDHEDIHENYVNADNIKSILDFSERAIETGNVKIIDYLQVIEYLEYLAFKPLDSAENGETASPDSDAAEETEDSKEVKEINQKIQHLIGLVAEKHACDVDLWDEEDRFVKPICARNLMLYAASYIMQLNKRDADILKPSIKLIDIFGPKHIDNYIDGASKLTANVEEGVVTLENLCRQFILETNEEYIEEDFNDLEGKDSGPWIKDMVKYLKQPPIQLFPESERPQELLVLLKKTLFFINTVSLDMGDSLELFPGTHCGPVLVQVDTVLGNVVEIFPVDSSIHTRHELYVESRIVRDEIRAKLKENISKELEKLEAKDSLESKDIENISKLTSHEKIWLECSNVSVIFNKEECARIHDKLFKLLLRAEAQHPDVPKILTELDFSGIQSGVERRYAVEQLTTFVRHAIQAEKTSFHGGIELLMGLDQQIKAASPGYAAEPVISEIKTLLAQHLGRDDFKGVAVKVDKYKDSSYFADIENAAKIIDSDITIAEQALVHELLEQPRDTQALRLKDENPPLRTAIMNFLRGTNNATALFENPSRRDQILKLFTTLPIPQFMEWVQHLSWLCAPQELPRLKALVAHAKDIHHPQDVSDTSYFLMTQGLLKIINAQPEGDEKSSLLATVYAMEDQHIEKVGGEKRDRAAEAAAAAELVTNQRLARQAERAEESSGSDDELWDEDTQSTDSGYYEPPRGIYLPL